MNAMVGADEDNEKLKKKMVDGRSEGLNGILFEDTAISHFSEGSCFDVLCAFMFARLTFVSNRVRGRMRRLGSLP